MPVPFASSGQGFAQPADAIQAFCRHLGELCDVLSTTYDSEALSKAAGLEKLQVHHSNIARKESLLTGRWNQLCFTIPCIGNKL